MSQPDQRPVELVAGEMRLWSDLAPRARRPAAGGAALAALLRCVIAEGPTPGRVLVAGPHAEDLLAVVAEALGGADLVVTVRALSDAERIAAARPGARVLCGGLPAVAAQEAGFDLVVALDGVERVLSDDDPDLDWRARLDLLLGLVTPTGRLLTCSENSVSIAAMADSRPVAERRDTGDWEPPAVLDRTRPSSLADWSAVVPERRVTGWAAFPLTTAPTVLARPEAAADLADPRVTRSLSVGSARSLAGRPVLFDPALETVRAVRAGVGVELAPGWVVLVEGRGNGAGSLPLLVVEDHPGRERAAVLSLAAGVAEILTGPGEPTGEEAWTVHLHRDGAAAGPTPRGRLLEEVLAEQVQREDLVALRAAVTSYAAWVRSMPPEAAALATPDNTLLEETGQEHALLDPTWTWTGGGDADTVVARVFLATARVLLDPRLRRAWPHWMGEREVARSLAAMAGERLPELAWNDGSALDASLGPVTEVPQILDADLRSLRMLTTVLTTELEAVKGMVTAHDRLAVQRDRQLEQRSARMAEAERRATLAEAELAGVRRELEELRSSTAARAGRAARHPAAAARAVLRRLQD